MTLIALFRPDVPIIISDVLLSHLALPTVRFTPTGIQILPKKERHTYQPSGFCQKTVLLHDDHVAFTGTGKVPTLKLLAADLRDKIHKGMTREALEPWMRSKQGLCGQSTSVMVSWYEESGYVTGKVGNGIRELPFGADGAVFCGGSGVDWLKRNLIKDSSTIETIGAFQEHEMVRALAIGQTAQHLAQERFMGLRDSFGGGFQITYCDGARFVPVSQVVYFTFLVEHDASGPVEMTLSNPVIVQRWTGRRLAFELWWLDRKGFDLTEEQATIRAQSKVRETVVPPLLHARAEPARVEQLLTGEYVNAQTLHHRAGRLIGLGGFQMMGDPKLNKLMLNGRRNELVEIALSRDLFDTWSSIFTPMPSAGRTAAIKPA